jgi:hypothetical protein
MKEKSSSVISDGSTRQLSDKVVKAAEDARRGSNLHRTTSLAQLRLVNMRLHGREDDIKLLKSKLVELKNRSADTGGEGKRPELILVSGVSGTGKSALVMRGVRDQAQKMGLVFTGGKFDLNHTALPLSAFTDAMSSLAKHVMSDEGNMQKIQNDIKGAAIGEDDLMLLARVLPGCEDLLTSSGKGAVRPKSLVEEEDISGDGREAVRRVQYAIRRLLKVICSNLNGVVLFIDDLQVSIEFGTYYICHNIPCNRHISFLFHIYLFLCCNSGVMLQLLTLSKAFLWM